VRTASLLTPRRETILALVHASPGLCVRAIARRVGLNDTSADYHLRQLERAGKIVRRRRGRAVEHFVPGASA